MIAEALTDDDILRPGGAGMIAELGTVGWEGDTDDSYCSLGLAEENDGHTLVNITLFRGKDQGVTTRVGVAQGRQIRAMPSGPVWHIPPRGAQVLVIFPGGMDLTPGAGTFFLRGRTPAGEFNRKKTTFEVPADYDAWITRAGGENFFRLQPNGDVSLFSTNDGTPNGQNVYLSVGRTGIERVTPWVTERFGESYHLRHGAGASSAHIDIYRLAGMPLPAPLDVPQYVVEIGTNLLRLNFGSASAGNDTEAAIAGRLAKTDALLVTLTAIETALASINASLVAIGPALVPGAPATAALTAIGLTTTALVTTLPAAMVTAAAAVPSSMVAT